MEDSWDVEAVVQYRTYCRKEQWLIKWQGYGEDRNTWEPKESICWRSGCSSKQRKSSKRLWSTTSARTMSGACRNSDDSGPAVVRF